MSHIRIYQINLGRDTDRVAFFGRAKLKMLQGSSDINSGIYDLVFDGEVNFDSLEDVYRIFNGKSPVGYRARSMSVSDVVEIVGRKDKSEFYFCDTIGFSKVGFDAGACMIDPRSYDVGGNIIAGTYASRDSRAR